MSATLYQLIKAAGIACAAHESDLYIPDNEATRAILSGFPLQQKNASRFTNEAEPHKGERWIDVPFAYDPFWHARGMK